MKYQETRGRALKHRIYELLKTADYPVALQELFKMPPRKVINPLFAFLHGQEKEVRWAAVSVMGAIVSKLADQDMEAARVIMRRLMWNLNDESGGIGWGSPEAMGEILACHKRLADEYARVLLSYTRSDGNYLELEALQRGLLWGIGRAAQVRPELFKDGIPYLIPYLESGDPHVRALAARALGFLGAQKAIAYLERLKEDGSQVEIYLNRKHVKRQVRELVAESIKRLSSIVN